MLEAPGWPGHRAGQRVDVRLTAEDGYSRRAVLLDRLVAGGEPVAITVERLARQVPISRLWHAVPCFPSISEAWLRLLDAYRA